MAVYFLPSYDTYVVWTNKVHAIECHWLARSGCSGHIAGAGVLMLHKHILCITGSALLSSPLLSLFLAQHNCTDGRLAARSIGTLDLTTCIRYIHTLVSIWPGLAASSGLVVCCMSSSERIYTMERCMQYCVYMHCTTCGTCSQQPLTTVLHSVLRRRTALEHKPNQHAPILHRTERNLKRKDIERG